MNAAERAKMLEILVKYIEKALEEAVGPVTLPLMGDSTAHHMAVAALNVLEAVQDVDNFIADQLEDDGRERLGL